MDGMSVDSLLQTSQQREMGHQKPEGSESPTAPARQYAEDSGAPLPAVTQPIKGEIFQIDAMKTSQQSASEHDKPEGK